MPFNKNCLSVKSSLCTFVIIQEINFELKNEFSCLNIRKIVNLNES